ACDAPAWATTAAGATGSPRMESPLPASSTWPTAAAVTISPWPVSSANMVVSPSTLTACKPVAICGTTARHSKRAKMFTGMLADAVPVSRYATVRTGSPDSLRHCSTMVSGAVQSNTLGVSLKTSALTRMVSPATAWLRSSEYETPAHAEAEYATDRESAMG